MNATWIRNKTVERIPFTSSFILGHLQVLGQLEIEIQRNLLLLYVSETSSKVTRFLQSKGSQSVGERIEIQQTQTTAESNIQQ